MHHRKCYLLHNTHFMQKDIHWWNREESRGPFTRTLTRRWKKWQGRIENYINQSPYTSISLIILANTRRSAAFPYTRVTRKAVQIENKALFFKSEHLIPTVSTNVFYSTNLFLKLWIYEVHIIALFTVNFSHLHYNVLERECEAISGRNCKTARNCLTSTFKYIVMQISKDNREKGNWTAEWRNKCKEDPRSYEKKAWINQDCRDSNPDLCDTRAAL